MPFIHTPYGGVHLHKYGQGDRLMIAFHGYGSDGSVFQCWEKTLHNNITLYAVDLPFHGQTSWQKAHYTPEGLSFIIESILTMENKSQFEALGFSLGGRLWLSLQSAFANRITALYLLAPDGLGTTGTELVDWVPLPMRKLLSGITSYKKPLIDLSGKLYRNGWLNASSYRYFRHQLTDEERRLRLIHTWYSTAHFPMNRKAAIRQLQLFNIPTMIITGKDDQIVDTKKIQPLFNDIENVLLQEVPANHETLIEAAQSFINDGLMRYWKWMRQ